MALEILLEEGLKTVLKKGIKAAGGPIAGAAFTFTSLLYKVVDKSCEEFRDHARNYFHCSCIQICPDYWGATSHRMHNFVIQHQGMAFIFDGIALCHPQSVF